MFIIPAAIIAIIYLLLKVLVPTILIIALIALLCIYLRNREQADEKIESAKEKLNSAKDKATNIFDKVKFMLRWFKKKENDEEEGQELNDE